MTLKSCILASSVVICIDLASPPLFTFLCDRRLSPSMGRFVAQRHFRL